MPIFLQSYDPQDIIGMFRDDRFDGHCQLYREAKWLAQQKENSALAWASVVAEQARMIQTHRDWKAGKRGFWQDQQI